MEKLLKIKFKPKKDHFVIPKKTKELPIERVYKDGIIYSNGTYSLCSVVVGFNRYKDIIENLHKDINLQISFFNKCLDSVWKVEDLVFLVLSIKSTSYKNASKILFDEMDKIISNVEVLSDKGITVIHDLYNSFNARWFNFSELFEKSISLKNCFPEGLPIFYRNCFKIGSNFTRCYYFREISKDLIPELSSLYFTVNTSIHINKKNSFVKKTDVISSEIELESFDKGENKQSENLISTGIYLYTTADSTQELERRDNLIFNLCKKHKSNVEVLTYQSENALQSMLFMATDKVNINMFLDIEKINESLENRMKYADLSIGV